MCAVLQQGGTAKTEEKATSLNLYKITELSLSESLKIPREKAILIANSMKYRFRMTIEYSSDYQNLKIHSGIYSESSEGKRMLEVCFPLIAILFEKC